MSEEEFYRFHTQCLTLQKKKITYTYNSKGTLIAIKNYEYLTNE